MVSATFGRRTKINNKELIEEVSKNFENRHKNIKDEWEIKNDIVLQYFHTDKLEFSKNNAPYSIFPFDEKTCADLLCGRLNICFTINFSEIFRKFQRHGYDVIDNIFNHTTDATTNTALAVLNKGAFNFHIPPGYISRLMFEVLKPETLINIADTLYEQGPNKDYGLVLMNFTREPSLWL